MIGMRLENQGSEEIIGSHWEHSILNNELMNAVLSYSEAYNS